MSTYSGLCSVSYKCSVVGVYIILEFIMIVAFIIENDNIAYVLNIYSIYDKCAKYQIYFIITFIVMTCSSINEI